MFNYFGRYLLLHVAQGVLLALGAVAFLSGREQSVSAAVYLGACTISQAIVASRPRAEAKK